MTLCYWSIWSFWDVMLCHQVGSPPCLEGTTQYQISHSLVCIKSSNTMLSFPICPCFLCLLCDHQSCPCHVTFLCILYSLFLFQLDTLLFLFFFLRLQFFSTCFGPAGPSSGESNVYLHVQPLAPFPQSLMCRAWPLVLDSNTNGHARHIND